MKFVAILALAVAVEAKHHHKQSKQMVDISGVPPTVGLGHTVIPANREDYDNAAALWKGNW